MTQVHFSGSGGSGWRVSAQGHAEGSPETCAALSCLLTALGGYLLNLERAGEAEGVRCRLDSGDACISAQGGPAVEAAFQMTLVGLLQLERAKPERVRVEMS